MNVLEPQRCESGYLVFIGSTYLIRSRILASCATPDVGSGYCTQSTALTSEAKDVTHNCHVAHCTAAV